MNPSALSTQTSNIQPTSSGSKSDSMISLGWDRVLYSRIHEVQCLEVIRFFLDRRRIPI